jgi:hypothetical protein
VMLDNTSIVQQPLREVRKAGIDLSNRRLRTVIGPELCIGGVSLPRVALVALVGKVTHSLDGESHDVSG